MLVSNMLEHDQIKDILGLEQRGQLRVDSKELWEEISSSLPYCPVVYSNASIDYQLAYQRGHGGDWLDISIVIYWDNKPTALWPLSISIRDGQPMLTSHGAPVLPPVFIETCPLVSRKRITRSCLDLANSISIKYKIVKWSSSESFCHSIGMSEWHVQSMARGAICELQHELYLDLQSNITDIKKHFRKRYKSLINSGALLWNVGVLDSHGNESVWEEFRNLHVKVAGRVTRTDQTWHLQLQDVERQRAFLVWLRNDVGDMVGGGLFSFTSDEGSYSVGAYDRTLFEKPLGHVVQCRAIEELKRRGVIWYKLGLRPYTSDTPQPKEKVISIGEFKQGFSSHVFPKYCLEHKVDANDCI